MVMVPRVFEGIGGGFSRAAKKGEFCRGARDEGWRIEKGAS
jgi:hypothetical protein